MAAACCCALLVLVSPRMLPTPRAREIAPQVRDALAALIGRQRHVGRHADAARDVAFGVPERDRSAADRFADRLEGVIAEKARLAEAHPLRYLFWEATLRCDLACRHCGSDCRRDESAGAHELPAAVIKRELAAIAEVFDAKAITLAIIGGEPLLRPDLEEVGAFAAGLAWGYIRYRRSGRAPLMSVLQALEWFIAYGGAAALVTMARELLENDDRPPEGERITHFRQVVTERTGTEG